MRLALLAPVLVLAACPQPIGGPDGGWLPLGDEDVGTPVPPPDAGIPVERDDASQPGPDAAGAREDAGAQGADVPTIGPCTATRTLARANEVVDVTCPVPGGASGVTWGVDPPNAGGTITPGAPGTAKFAVPSAKIPKAFRTTTYHLRAYWKLATGDAQETVDVAVLGNVWLGRAPRAIAAFASDYTLLGDAVGAVPFKNAPRAVTQLPSGDVLVAQSTANGAPPVVILDSQGLPKGSFAANDLAGAPLFDSAKSIHPRAIAAMPDGTVWVTGGPTPAIFDSSGAFVGRPSASQKPSANTVGIARKPSGEIVISLDQSAPALGVYAPGGASYSQTPILTSPSGAYSDVEALLALDDGSLVVSVYHYETGKAGGVLAKLGPTFEPLGETPASQRTETEVPSHLVRVGEDFVTTEHIGTVNAAHPRRYGADLSLLGYLGDGVGSPGYVGATLLQ